ncbi:MAG: hypothetical protein EAZ77_05255 [Nostocales cyanobacterium]|nr:MAG: hypothetical protein EAZ77_05255 [Nostocales cyanobacterium]
MGSELGNYRNGGFTNYQEIWFLPKAAFSSLMLKYPSIQQVIHSQLAQDLHEGLLETKVSR